MSKYPITPAAELYRMYPNLHLSAVPEIVEAAEASKLVTELRDAMQQNQSPQAASAYSQALRRQNDLVKQNQARLTLVP